MRKDKTNEKENNYFALPYCGSLLCLFRTGAGITGQQNNTLRDSHVFQRYAKGSGNHELSVLEALREKEQAGVR